MKKGRLKRLENKKGRVYGAGPALKSCYFKVLNDFFLAGMVRFLGVAHAAFHSALLVVFAARAVAAEAGAGFF